jgi:hypothetical protein
VLLDIFFWKCLLIIIFQSYTLEDKEQLGFAIYTIIASSKEEIATERKRLSNHAPFPRNFDDAPFCEPAKHTMCKRIWSERWFFVVVRKIHDIKDPLALFSIPDFLESMDHKGMNPGCKDFILTWLRNCEHVGKEENLIRDTVTHICNLLM